MKAVLVIDMPKDCTECPLSGCGECDALGGKYDGRCPLRPVHALKSAGRDYIIYERQYLYKNLEREFDLMKKAREFDESNTCD